MKKTAFIWRESIYKAAVDGVYRCNQCKCKIFDAKTGDVNGNVGIVGLHEWMYCPDCSNVVARIEEIDDDSPKGYRRGLWKE